MRARWWVAACLTLVALGCGSTASAPPTPGTTAQAPPPPPPASVAPGDGKTIQADDDVEKAQAGVGRKGRGYGEGMVATPIKAYFSAKQQLEFAKVTHALNMYKAAYGNVPKTHEAFMKDIIEENSIDLPELPEGDEYIYDPKTMELMVRHPKR